MMTNAQTHTTTAPAALHRWVWINLAGPVVLAAGMLVALEIGSTSTGLREALTAPRDSAAWSILFHYRLPTVLLAAIVGATLAVTGAVFQAILRNPLGDPFLLGVSGGAALGVTAAVVLGLAGGVALAAGFGFAGALGAILLVYLLSRVRGRVERHALLLAGVVVNAICGAGVMFLTAIASPHLLPKFRAWLMGNLDVSVWPDPFRVLLGLALVTTAAGAWLAARGSRLNLFALGEDTVRTSGADPERLKIETFLVSSLAVGVAVSVAGPIGFVGLIVPHALRRILGPDHRTLLPACFWGGAVFLVLADAAARALFPAFDTRMPVGVLTALLGGPFFLWLLHRETRET